MRDYSSIDGLAQAKIIVNKSKFIATASHIFTEEQAQEFVQSVCNKYPDATHNCYGYISDPERTKQKFSDDKEPHGSAGLPILGVLRHKELSCIAVVVTRYYGGHKLGIGGLVSSYSSACAAVLENRIVLYKYSYYYSVNLDYSALEQATILIDRLGGVVQSIEYLENVLLCFACPVNFADNIIQELLNFSKGKIVPKLLNKNYYIYK